MDYFCKHFLHNETNYQLRLLVRLFIMELLLLQTILIILLKFSQYMFMPQYHHIQQLIM